MNIAQKITNANNNYVDDETPWTYRVKNHPVSANISPRAMPNGLLNNNKTANTTATTNTKA